MGIAPQVLQKYSFYLPIPSISISPFLHIFQSESEAVTHTESFHFGEQQGK